MDLREALSTVGFHDPTISTHQNYYMLNVPNKTITLSLSSHLLEIKEQIECWANVKKIPLATVFNNISSRERTVLSPEERQEIQQSIIHIENKIATSNQVNTERLLDSLTEHMITPGLTRDLINNHQQLMQLFRGKSSDRLSQLMIKETIASIDLEGMKHDNRVKNQQYKQRLKDQLHVLRKALEQGNNGYAELLTELIQISFMGKGIDTQNGRDALDLVFDCYLERLQDIMITHRDRINLGLSRKVRLNQRVQMRTAEGELRDANEIARLQRAMQLQSDIDGIKDALNELKVIYINCLSEIKEEIIPNLTNRNSGYLYLTIDGTMLPHTGIVNIKEFGDLRCLRYNLEQGVFDWR